MDLAVGNNRVALRAAAQRFVADLGHPHQPWVKQGAWVKNARVYYAHMARMLKHVCSTCQYDADTMAYMRLDFEGADYRTVPGINQYANTVQLPQRTMACLNNPPAHRRSVWVFIAMVIPNNSTGHGLCLLFDTRRRKQFVFDPHCACDDRLSDNQQLTAGAMTRALCQRRLHPDYEPVAMQQCLWPLRADTLQQRVEVPLHHVDRGVCGILCMLVIICCIRFNYYNPRDMADMIADELVRPIAGNNAGAATIHKIIRWYVHLMNLRAHANIPVHLVFPSPSDHRCNTFSSWTGRVCSRTVCRQGTSANNCSTCWQHRYLGFNCEAPNRRCATAHHQCNM